VLAIGAYMRRGAGDQLIAARGRSTRVHDERDDGEPGGDYQDDDHVLGARDVPNLLRIATVYSLYRTVFLET
jgi:hypothetical protein